MFGAEETMKRREFLGSVVATIVLVACDGEAAVDDTGDTDGDTDTDTGRWSTTAR